MKAIEVRDTKLQWQDVAEPFKLGHKEVLIENYATAINRADLSQRQGVIHHPQVQVTYLVSNVPV